MFFITSRMRTGSAAPTRILKQETPIQGGTACSGSGKTCTIWWFRSMRTTEWPQNPDLPV